MAKYYIQSGQSKFIVLATDPEGAALWMVNRMINRLLPDNIDSRTETEEGLLLLVGEVAETCGEVFNISEIGFGRSEVAELDSELLFKRWFELLRAMNHLFEQL